MATVLDHLVLAVPDLDAAVADLARRTGVEPVPGGVHPGGGTRNALLGLTWQGSSRHYLEVLGPDPAQQDVPEEDMLLGVGPTLTAGAPRMYGWAVRTEPQDLDPTLARARAAGLDVGEAVTASRETPSGLRLSWRLAVPRPLGLGGVQPFLLAWDGAHPTDADLPTVIAVPPEAGAISTNVDELVRAAALLVNEPEEARRRGDVARRVALERYGLEAFLQSWDVLLGGLAPRLRRGRILIPSQEGKNQ